jgi:hypothetical protein
MDPGLEKSLNSSIPKFLNLIHTSHLDLLQDESAEIRTDGRTSPRFRLECSQAAVATQHVVHIGRLGVAGSLLVPLSGVPTAKVDMSFFTSPWQSGQFTLVSWCITSLSKVY